MSRIVHEGRLGQEAARRGWTATELARESTLGHATVSAATISARSAALIAAQPRVLTSAVIEAPTMAATPRELNL